MACKVYRNIDRDSKRYHQLYYYPENDHSSLQSIFSTSPSLFAETTGEKSYLVSAGDTLSIDGLPSYYRITLIMKYRAAASVTLQCSATTEQ